MTFRNKLVKLFGVRFNSYNPQELQSSHLVSCLIAYLVNIFQKHNEGEIIYLVQKLEAGR